MAVRAVRLAGVIAGVGVAAALAASGPAAADTPDGTDRAAPSGGARGARTDPGGTGPSQSEVPARPSRAHRMGPDADHPVRPAAGQRVSDRPPAAAAPVLALPVPTAISASASAVPIATWFNNVTPHPSAVQGGQAPSGPISGVVQPGDPDSNTVTFALARAPERGSVVVAAAGQYTYTPDPLRAHAPYTDTFVVSASDAGSGFHIHGLGGLINLLTLGLIGASGHTAESTVTVRVGAFNNAPTASISMGGPDPLTGAVDGRVQGADPNGDVLSYTAPPTTAKGILTIDPTGDFHYVPTPDARASALPGEQDTFAVTVDDGYGGVSIVNVAVPLGSSLPATELSTFCGCTLMPADSVFHADVSRLGVLAQSAAWTQLLGGTLRAGWGGTPWMGSVGGMPVNVVDADRSGETVIFNRGYSTSGPSIDDRPYAIPDYPIVEGMPDVPAWDRHLLVLQQGTCISQELYNVANGVELPAAGVLDALGNAAYKALYGSAWIAEAGVHIDMSSPLYPAQGWANASQLPYLPLILRPDDLDRGTIDHMLGITIAKDRGTGYAWPARAGDGTGTNPDGVPMGTVFRLRADFDISAYAPATQVVLRALQQHGAVVYDSFSPGVDGMGLLAMSNGWTGTDHVVAQRELSSIPVDAFEAVDVLGLALDPTTGWMIRT